MKVDVAQISHAKKNLSKYPILNQLFEGFKDYSEPETDYSNRVFLLCIDGQNDHLLAKLEQGLVYFKLSDESRNRLIENKFHVSMPTSEEIITAYDIGLRIGFENIHMEKPNQRSADIIFHLGEREVCIELTSLNDAEYEVKKILEGAFEKVRGIIAEKCGSADFYLNLEVNTSRLPRDGKELDSETIVDYLVGWVEKLHICDLVKSDGLIRFSDYWSFFSWKDNELFLADLIEDPLVFSGSHEIDKIKQDVHLTNWAKRVRIGDFRETPFKSVIFQTGIGTQHITLSQENLVATFQSGKIVSSDDSSKLETQGFIARLNRAINYKKEHRQFIRGKPVLFFIKARLKGRDFELFSDEFEDLKEGIVVELKKHPELAGILLYSTSYQNGRYVANPNADKGIELAASEIAILGVEKYNIVT